MYCSISATERERERGDNFLYILLENVFPCNCPKFIENTLKPTLHIHFSVSIQNYKKSFGKKIFLPTFSHSAHSLSCILFSFYVKSSKI